MAVRNSVEVGTILTKMVLQLSKDQELCRLLCYTDPNPFSTEKKDLNGFELIGKNFLVVPQVNAQDFNTASKIVFVVPKVPVEDNLQFKELNLSILIYTPYKSWLINNEQLRPFSIIGRIEALLPGKRYESLGEIKYDGYVLQTIDDNISVYRMDFRLDLFN